MDPSTDTIDIVQDLAELERRRWGPLSAELHATGALVCEGDGGDDGGGDDGGSGDDDEIKISKAEHAKLKRGIAEKDRELREQKAERSKLEDRVGELEAGDDDVKKLEQRIERAEQRAKDAETRATEAETDRDKSRRERDAIDVATRLKFRNPARAIRMLDPSDLEDTASAEAALERLMREEPYLATDKKQREVTDPAERRATGGDDPPAGDGGEGGGSDKNGDEPFGDERLRRHYAAQEKEREQREKEAANAGSGGE